MKKVFFDHIVHGSDYNPEQWIRTPEVWDEDMRLMKLAHINCASVGIFRGQFLNPRKVFTISSGLIPYLTNAQKRH